MGGHALYGKSCFVWEVMLCMGGHVFRLAYLIGGYVLLEDMSNSRTGLTGEHVLLGIGRHV